MHAGRAIERAFREHAPDGEFVLLAVGKAAAAMSRAALDGLAGRLRGGAITVPDGRGLDVAPLALHEAAHPVPDARSVHAAEDALRRAAALPDGVQLLLLLSGGASSLWCAPVDGISLADKRGVTDLLLRCGADIRELNTVRRHLSRAKGGGLARAAGSARVLTLAISDVRGDAPDVIGSGPSVVDPTTHRDALAVLRRHALLDRVPPRVRACLEAGARSREAQAPAGAPAREYRVIASLDDALAAAEADARRQGLRTRQLGAVLYGEARSLAPWLVDEVRRARRDGIDLLIAGGEPTVTVRGDGLGGRCQELALAFGLEIDGDGGVLGLFAGTDGRDGPTDAAGAWVDGDLPARARAVGLDPRRSLERNDSTPLLAATGDLFVTGPTQTNVNDLALVRVRSR